MKNILTFFSILFATSIFSQDYKVKISAEMCRCAKDLKVEGKTNKQIEFALGVCMLQVSKPYHNEIKREFNIDLKNDIGKEEKMGQLGEYFGMIMVNDCPDVFQKILPQSYFADDDPYTKELKMINGTVSKIEKNDFVVFHVSGDNRILSKLYWVSKVDSDLDLPSEYHSLINKRVTVSFYGTELFDPKSNQYKSVNVITSLKTD